MSTITPFRYQTATAPGSWRNVSGSTRWVTPDDRLHCIPYTQFQVPAGRRWRLDRVVAANWTIYVAHWSCTIEVSTYNRDALMTGPPNPTVPPSPPSPYRSTLAWGALIGPGDTEVLEPGLWMNSLEWFCAASDPPTGGLNAAVLITVSGLEFS